MELGQYTNLFLAGNDAILNISVEPVAGERNVKAVNHLVFENPFVFSQPPVSGQGFFTLKWGIELMFTVTHTPSSTVFTQLPFLEDYYNNLPSYLTAVADRLNKINALSKDFKIEVVEGQYIRLTAYRYGSSYNIEYLASTYGFPTHFESGSVVNHISGDTQTVFNSRYVDLSILADNAARFRKNLISRADRDDLLCQINVSKPIYNTLHFPYFSFPEAIPLAVVHANAKKAVRIVNEGSNITFSETLTTTLNKTFYAIMGRFSETRLHMLAQNLQDFEQFLDASGYRRFLTFCPSPKKTDIYAPEKLYWIAPADGTYKVHIAKEFKCIVKYSVTEIELKKYDIIEIQCSYKKISADELYRIYNYEVQVQNANNARVSDVFRFEVSRDYQRYARYFLFVNSFGMYDCLRTTGAVTKTDEINKTVVPLDLQSRIELGIPEIQTDVETTVEYEIETGYGDIGYTSFIKEMLESPCVYVLKKSKAYRVSIPKGKLETQEGRFIHNQKIVMRSLPHDDFTPDYADDNPILPDFDPSFSADFTSLTSTDYGDYVPLANAGADKTTDTGSVQLAATPAPEEMTGTWTKYTGPGTVTFDNANAHDAIASFSAAGTYILRWTVVYGTCTEVDEIVVEVTGIVIMPTVFTNDVTNITPELATFNGEIISNGATISDKGFVYAIGHTPTIDDTKISKGAGAGIISQTENLAVGIYKLRAYATTPYSTYYGDEVSFEIILSIEFSLNVLGSGVGVPEAEISCTIIGSADQRGFVYALGYLPTINDFKVIMPQNEYQNTILMDFGTYYIRPYAIINGITYYGDVKTFKNSQIIIEGDIHEQIDVVSLIGLKEHYPEQTIFWWAVENGNFKLYVSLTESGVGYIQYYHYGWYTIFKKTPIDDSTWSANKIILI